MEVLFTFIVIGCIIGLTLFNKYYAFGVVSGWSMRPSYNHGEFIFVRRKYVLKEGKVYLIKFDGIVMIKRLERIKASPSAGKVSLYFVGDNLEDSWDSRYFGWLSTDVVVGEVTKLKELIYNYERSSNSESCRKH